MNKDQLLNEFARELHQTWSNWVNYSLGADNSIENDKWAIPKDNAIEWLRMANVPFAELTDDERTNSILQAKVFINWFIEYRQQVDWSGDVIKSYWIDIPNQARDSRPKD